MHAHHGDLVAHSKTGNHHKNATPFSSTRTLFDAGVSSVSVDTSVRVSFNLPLAEDNLDAAREDGTKQRCRDYLVELLRQLRQ